MTTLLIPGLTLPILIQWLKMKSHSNHDELHLIRKQLVSIAEEKLQHFLNLEKINKKEFDFLQTYFASQYQVLDMFHSADDKIQNMELARRKVIQFQRKRLIEMWRLKEIDDIVLNHLEQELDLVEVHMVRAELK
jgi:CPA1 family monovalent cation:H+ antiporter